MDTTDFDLIEMIYTAGLIPEVWPDVIDRMARRMKAPGGSIFTLSEGHLAWDAPANTKPIMEAYIAGGWAQKNPRLTGLITRAHAGFVLDEEVSPPGFDQLPIVKDFLRPHGIFYTAATMINGARGDMAVFSIDRGYEHGAFAQGEMHWLNGLRPHLARSVALTSRLRMKQSSTATNALSLVGIPAAIVRKHRGIVATNMLFDAMIGSVFICGAFGSLSLVDRRADKALRDMLAIDSSAHPIVRSIPITGENGPVGVLHAIPACRQASDFLGSDSTLLVVAQPRENVPASVECLKWLYDLTPAEALVASKLSEGRSVDEIATETLTSVNTVRTHVRRVLRKTGFSRQTDFLMSISSLNSLQTNLKS